MLTPDAAGYARPNGTERFGLVGDDGLCECAVGRIGTLALLSSRLDQCTLVMGDHHHEELRVECHDSGRSHFLPYRTQTSFPASSHQSPCDPWRPVRADPTPEPADHRGDFGIYAAAMRTARSLTAALGARVRDVGPQVLRTDSAASSFVLHAPASDTCWT